MLEIILNKYFRQKTQQQSNTLRKKEMRRVIHESDIVVADRHTDIEYKYPKQYVNIKKELSELTKKKKDDEHK